MGKVFLPHSAAWLDDLLMDVLSFPIGKHDDYTDFLSLIGRMLDTMVGGRAPHNDTSVAKDKWAAAFAKRNQDESNWKTA